jgi:multiple sugar transport system substrate-binding protein
MMTWRKITLIAMCLLLTLGFVSAGGVADVKTSDTGALSGKITMWHSFTQGARFDSIKKSADDFMKLHPGVEITIEVFPWNDFYTKWTTGLMSGSVPDISTALPNHVVEMISVDAIVPLNDVIDKMGRTRFFEAPIAEMTVNGLNYAVPLYSHAQVMWYRKDLLAAAGLTVPQTWDEFYEAAKKLNNPPAVYGAPVPMGLNDMMATRYLNFYVRTAGDTLVTKDGKANLTSKAAIELQDSGPSDYVLSREGSV